MIITLCGSTRFRDDFHRANALLSLAGHVVLSVGLFGHADDCVGCGHPADHHAIEPNRGTTQRGRCLHNTDGRDFCQCGQFRTLTDAEKVRLDALHFRKIELSDAVLVVNPRTPEFPNGYHGESTARELVHATRLGKAVFFLSDDDLAYLCNEEVFPR